MKYDSSIATDRDIGLHTIAFSVSSMQYPVDIESIEGTFNFTIECPRTAIITEGSILGTTYSFDFSNDKFMRIPLPGVAISPPDCFEIVWSVRRVSDDVDMEHLLPQIFSVSKNALDLTSSKLDKSTRLDLLNNSQYYF